MANLIDSIVPIIVFIAVVSGIISSIKEAAAKNSKVSAAPQQPSRAQSEIEAFLSGAQSQPVSPQKPASPPPRPAQQASRTKQNPRQKSQKNTPVKTKSTADAQKPRSVGSGVSEHVDSFIGQHVKSHMGRDVDAFVNKDINERVKSHLGSQSSQPVEMTSSDTGSKAADDLLGVLKSRVGVRHAILVNEILSKPLALRKR